MAQLSELPLLEFIPALSPEFSAPYHLAPWCEQIEACLKGGVRALCAVPIRHHKSETTYHGIAWLLTRDHTMRIILMVADHQVAQDRAKRIRQICETADVGPERGQNVMTSWKNQWGGGVQVMSAGQSKLGQDCDVLIFDDPLSEQDAFKLEARSAVDLAISHYTARAGRTGRRGSVLGIMSRWHPDDPIGRRLIRKAAEWISIHAAAISVNDNGEESAFAPDVMDLDELNRRRSELKEADPTERIWYAQFQNDPQPDALGLFRSPTRYVSLPSGSFRTVIGADLSYSSMKHADYFALVVLKIFVISGYELELPPGMAGAGRFVDQLEIAPNVHSGGTWKPAVREVAFVIAAWRERWDPAQSEQIIRLARGQHPGATVYSYMSGPEKGIAYYMAEKGIPVEVIPARFSKRQRAQRTIDLSNANRVRFPEQAPWVSGFVARMTLFSGDESAGDDDEIDALVSAVDGGMGFVLPAPRTLGQWRNR